MILTEQDSAYMHIYFIQLTLTAPSTCFAQAVEVFRVSVQCVTCMLDLRRRER